MNELNNMKEDFIDCGYILTVEHQDNGRIILVIFKDNIGLCGMSTRDYQDAISWGKRKLGMLRGF